MSGGVPDPGRAADVAEFVGLLNELRAWAGGPSYRALARKVGPLMRPPQALSQSTLGEAFQPRRRRLSIDLVVAIVRALGLDDQTVDRWRQACVRVHVDVKAGGPVGVFHQLPAELATFTGRGVELARLLATTTAPSSCDATTVVISAIEGMAGVGKTQLAVRAAHTLVRSGRYAEVQLYVNLRGFDPERPPVDPSSVLDAFLRQLQVPAQQIPDGLDERAAMFRYCLSGRNALVLLDNAADEDQIRALIPSGPSCLVLITSRRTLTGLDGVSVHLLDVFAEGEAVALLARIVGADRVAAEPEVAEQIAELCGHLPLAVALAAARLRARPAWSLAVLAERLRSGGLEATAAGGRGLRRAFALSYDGLSLPVRRVFALLGVHPGPDATAASTAALAGISLAEADTVLEHLQDEHLVRQRTAGRYELHDLLRTFAAEATADQAADTAAAAISRVTSWYLLGADRAARALGTPITPVSVADIPGTPPPPFATREEALAWFDAERANLAAAVRAAADHRLPALAWKLAVSQQGYFLLRHHLDDWVSTYETALAAARAADDGQGQDRVLTGLGRVYRTLRRLAEAESCHRQVIELARRRRVPDPSTREATALNNLATVLNDQNRFDQALAELGRALAICRDRDDGRLEGFVRGNIGIACHRSGRLLDGIENYRRAIEIHQRATNRHSEMIMWNNLGDALRDHDPDAALDAFERSLALSEELQDIPYRGTAYLNIGDMMDRAGNTARARQSWTTALAFFEDIGHRLSIDTRKRLGGTD
ncbi:tetratricopeptide repeat protein [Solihabitans fulvus]|uniref:tetratricopeptide repeat protein n=1 Tax=Solihabitans fulvus TaxID=1892852 RepID=UPI001661A68A|nr:tetratricopeptide repeat protein [Solihabitans fulvus]